MDFRKTEFLDSIITLALEAIEYVHQLNEYPDPSRKETDHGGYLVITQDDTVHLCAPVGRMIPEKELSYMSNALEKANRIRKEGLQCSWDSRDLEKRKYGGGIRAGEYIVSFSGLAEECDEMVSMYVAMKLELADFEDIYSFNRDNHNPSLKEYGMRSLL